MQREAQSSNAASSSQGAVDRDKDNPESKISKDKAGKERKHCGMRVYLFTARNTSPCVNMPDWTGDNGCSKREFVFNARILTLFDSILGGVDYWYCVYFHLGAMQP